MSGDLEELGTKVNALVEKVTAVDNRHRRANWRTYVPIFTSLLTVVIAVISVWTKNIADKNQTVLDELQTQFRQKQEEFVEKQAIANLNVSIIHETLAVIDSGNDKKKSAFALLNGTATP
jgi:hypothetical protein